MAENPTPLEISRFFDEMFQVGMAALSERKQVSAEKFLAHFGVTGTRIQRAGNGSDLPAELLSHSPKFGTSGEMQILFKPEGIEILQGYERSVQLSISESEKFISELLEATRTLQEILEDES